MIGYRIFEKHPDGPRTLYHGHDGSRTLPCDVILSAGERTVHNPGKKTGPGYEEGFHVFQTRAECERYITGFTRTDRELVICKVRYMNAVPKPRSRSGVLLAKYICVPRVEWNAAVRDA